MFIRFFKKETFATDSVEASKMPHGEALERVWKSQESIIVPKTNIYAVTHAADGETLVHIRGLDEPISVSDSSAYALSEHLSEFTVKAESIPSCGRKAPTEVTVRHCDSKVGAQKFTYSELEKAWNALKSKVESDPDHEEYDYDIRNGYDTEGFDPQTNPWNMDFSLYAIEKELESIHKIITFGDLEVHWNDMSRNEADSDGHGILIQCGKIIKVY